jgi:hypothetical protein
MTLRGIPPLRLLLYFGRGGSTQSGIYPLFWTTTKTCVRGERGGRQRIENCQLGAAFRDAN